MFNSNCASVPLVASIDGNGCNNGMNGFGDGGWLWIIVVFALLFGWGNNGFGNGFGGNNCGGYPFIPYQLGNNYTDAAVQRGFDNQSVMNKLNGLENGLCDGFYAVNTSLLNGFHGVDNAVCTLGYQTQQGFNDTNVTLMQGNNALQAQLAQCCCDLKTGQMQLGNQVERGFCDVNYNLATNTNAIIQNAHCDTDRVLAKINEIEMSRKDETIDSLRSQVNALNLAQSQANQNTYLINQLRPCPIPAYPTCNPWGTQVTYGACGTYGTFGSGCGGCNC